GNPVSLTAGLATIDILRREKIHQKVNAAGDELHARLRDIIDDHGLGYTVSGIGSIFKIFFGGEVHNYQDALKCDRKAYLEFFGRMLKSGVFLPPSQFESNFLSSAHSTDDIEKTINAYEANLA
ncbi:MAG: aspartate aminotransferase family protein, partial [Euryarchaeota archaeon]|nr:aspartate aminotransferase family protein [Euryarchaeota archaeon]